MEIELYQGTKLIGPDSNESQIKSLVKIIEKSMQDAFTESSLMGSESRAMDDRDDTVYEYYTELKKLGFRIE
jgi:hypothetical protein